MGTILAIDPGNMKSGYVVVEHDGEEIHRVLKVGKKSNEDMFGVIVTPYDFYDHFAIEMVAGMGMPVGAEVFDTCFWIGRFWEYVESHGEPRPMQKIFRREEKLYLCGRASAKDVNIRQALVDRYAPGQPNFGKGTKKNPGFFYGFSADMWAAMAVAVTYFDKYIKGVKSYEQDAAQATEAADAADVRCLRENVYARTVEVQGKIQFLQRSVRMDGT